MTLTRNISTFALLFAVLFIACGARAEQPGANPEAEALYERGNDFFQGDNGTPVNNEEAFNCWKKAAEMGHANAQHSLALCYLTGKGVAKDDVEAVKWFRKAAQQGYEPAIDALKELDEE